MALRPGLTDLSQRTVSEELGTRYAAGVNFSNGPLPSAEIGQRIVESQVRNLGEITNRLLAEYHSAGGWRAPDLNETECIWQRFEHLTRQYWDLRYCDLGTDRWLEIPDWGALET